MKKHTARLSGMFLIVMFIFSHCNNQSQFDENTLAGYWHSPLPSNQSIGITIYLYQENNAIKGKAFFTHEDELTNEVAIHELEISRNKIEFDLPSQGTHFSGKITSAEMKGGFHTPGNPELKIQFTKTELDKIPAYEFIKKTHNAYDLFQWLAPEQLKADFDVVKTALQSHPQMNLYTSKAHMELYFQNAEKQLTGGMKAIDFIKLVAPVIAQMKCYHTQLVLPEKVRNAFLQNTKSIPLDVFFIDSKATVRSCFDEHVDIPPGSEILEINGRTSAEIVEKLAFFISADGNNASHKLEEINQNFWMLYHYLESPESYQLKIKPSTRAGISTISLPAMKSEWVANAMMKSSRNSEDAPSDQVPVSFTMDAHAGILKIRSFAFYDIELFKAKIRDYFQEISQKKLAILIVDLRGNTGGHPALAADLITYFISKPIHYLKEPDNERYAELLALQTPKDEKFQGRAFFLCDGNSLSSTAHLLALVKYHQLGSIVGDIPGGSFYCSDESKLFDLPNSGLQVAVAQTAFVVAADGYKKGDEIIPDFIVKLSLIDMLSNRDKIMEFVMGLSE